MKQQNTLNVGWLWLSLFGIVLIAFLALALSARTAGPFPIDLPITQQMQAALGSSQAITQLMELFSNRALAALFIVAALAVAAWRRAWHQAILIAGAPGTAYIVSNYILKPLIARPRPSATLVQVIQTDAGFSFPSDHTVFYFTLAAVVIFLLWQLQTTPRAQLVSRLGMLIACGVVLLVGISRIVLGEHWFSDVVGGMLFGCLWFGASLLAYRFWLAR